MLALTTRQYRIRMYVVPLLLGLCLVHLALANNSHFEFLPEKHGHRLQTRALGMDNPNVYIDGILLVVRPLLGLVDPMKLPPMQRDFHSKIPFDIINATGGVSSNSTLGGFSSLYRIGDSASTKTTDGTKIKISLGFKMLVFNSSSSAFFSTLTAPFDFSASIANVQATTELFVPTSSSLPMLTGFTIDDMGDAKVTISNSGYVGFLVKRLADMVLNVLKDAVKSNLAKPLLDVINESIGKISIMDLIKNLG